jgi:hypothetical protein
MHQGCGVHGCRVVQQHAWVGSKVTARGSSETPAWHGLNSRNEGRTGRGWRSTAPRRKGQNTKGQQGGADGLPSGLLTRSRHCIEQVAGGDHSSCSGSLEAVDEADEKQR